MDWSCMKRDRRRELGTVAGRMASRIPVLSHPPNIAGIISPERQKQYHPPSIQLTLPCIKSPAEEAAASGSSSLREQQWLAVGQLHPPIFLRP